jgi:hypothetical protein
MPRYLVLRSFTDGLDISADERGAEVCLKVVSNNILDEVTWIRSFVTGDRKRSFCLYDAPSPEALRRAARRNNLPVDLIIEVSVLEPYFFMYH